MSAEDRPRLRPRPKDWSKEPPSLLIVRPVSPAAKRCLICGFDREPDEPPPCSRCIFDTDELAEIDRRHDERLRLAEAMEEVGNPYHDERLRGA